MLCAIVNAFSHALATSVARHLSPLHASDMFILVLVMVCCLFFVVAFFIS